MLGLVEEVAKQPGVAYIALVAADGRVLIHSRPDQVGTILYSPEELQNCMWATTPKAVLIRTIRACLKPTRFLPLPARAARGHAGPYGHGPHDAGRPPRRMPSGELEDKYIFVGLDASHFAANLHEYVFHLSAIAGLVTLAGLVGIVLLFYIQNYRFSKRMLEDTQALAAQVINSLPAGLVVTDPHGIISLSNRHGRDMLGLSGQEKTPPSLHDAPVLDWQA